MQKKFVSLFATALLAAPLASAFAADSGLKPRGLEVDDQGRGTQTQFAKASGDVHAGNIGIDALGRAAARPATAATGDTLLSGGEAVNVSAVSRG